jgi:hypothetical protein
MSGNVVAAVAWLGGGVLLGLAGANSVWSDPRRTSSPGLDASVVFAAAVALAPFVAAGLVLAGVAWCGAWLLPAFRERKRAERAERVQATQKAQRAAVDRLHHELGLPPVDWTGAR